MSIDKSAEVQGNRAGIKAAEPVSRHGGDVAMLKPAGNYRAATRNLVVLTILFCVPLYHLAQFALGSDLYSYILLMPFVAGYLIWQKRPNFGDHSRPLYKLGVALMLAGLCLLAGYFLALRSDANLTIDDRLSFTTGSYILLLIGLCCLGFGRGVLRAIAFPLGLLIFMIPMPTVVMASIETFLQYGSAFVTDGMLTMAGTPFVRDDLIFHLSDISIRVAPECSGIHSTYILLITSLLAGYLFLNSSWKRATLALFVLPLALLRNGFRVFTISELCVHVGPQMIDSPIHHKGGPIFFILSLIPFFILLVLLQRHGRINKNKKAPGPSGN
jgi:exosortase C (VPDSG-CTERM-specific)